VKNRISIVLLVIIAANLTIQTMVDTIILRSYSPRGPQRVIICDPFYESFHDCAEISGTGVHVVEPVLRRNL